MHTSLRIQLQRRCSLGYHKIALKNGVSGHRPDSTDTGQGPLSTYCEHSNQTMGCTKGGECFDTLRKILHHTAQSETNFKAIHKCFTLKIYKKCTQVLIQLCYTLFWKRPNI
jgi:hypothetical protein